jgi:hypothetical protein
MSNPSPACDGFSVGRVQLLVHAPEHDRMMIIIVHAPESGLSGLHSTVFVGLTHKLLTPVLYRACVQVHAQAGTCFTPCFTPGLMPVLQWASHLFLPWASRQVLAQAPFIVACINDAAATNPKAPRTHAPLLHTRPFGV